MVRMISGRIHPYPLITSEELDSTFISFRLLTHSHDHLTLPNKQTMLSQPMSHLCMTDGYYILSPYAAVNLFPRNQPPPQVYYLAQTLAPANFQLYQQ
jgi:hypothetical protein